jgi:hypothetical protein
MQLIAGCAVESATSSDSASQIDAASAQLTQSVTKSTRTDCRERQGTVVEKIYNCRADLRARREANESFDARTQDFAASVMRSAEVILAANEFAYADQNRVVVVFVSDVVV